MGKLRNYRFFLADIFDSINKINKYTEGMAYDDFSRDSKTVDAVARNFEIIGEVANQLPKSYLKVYPEIEWKSLINFRKVIIHEYFGVDKEIMWEIINSKLPTLREKINRILNTIP